MKIRTRLSIQFSLIVASILILFSAAVYFFSADYRKQEFYTGLRDKGLTTGRLFIEVDEVDSVLLKIIDKNTVSVFPQEEVVIFDNFNKEVYRNNDTVGIVPTADEIKKIRQEKEYRYRKGQYEIIGLEYRAKNKDYVVVASAIDVYGFSKLRNLRFILITGLVGSVMLTLLGGWIFSGEALKPISKVVQQVETITGFNLKKRVGEGNGKDEIAQLAITFNQMLDRIEAAFEAQRSFVSNASHELRTPLTAITGQLEVTLLNKRSAIEYENILHSVLDDIRDLNKLTNGLLEIAQASIDFSQMKLKSFRVDEMIWQARNEVMKRHDDYTIHINFKSFPDNENELIIPGIETLFKTAIINLMENGCKYSADKQVTVSFSCDAENIYLEFTDNGIGISPADLKLIYEPFYRGENARKFPGQGLGLSLTRRIVDMHRGSLNIFSELNKGTTINLSFSERDSRIQEE
jgi:signal transduction histidine kinase